jgi:hypothetical protein
LWKEGMAERPKNASGMISTVDFGTSRDLTDDMEPMWTPDDCEHEPFALDIGFSYYCHFIFGQDPCSVRAREKEKHDSRPSLDVSNRLCPPLLDTESLVP